MQACDPETKQTTKVRGTEILATDTPRQYREKLARIAMDEMYQFVAVLDAEGTLLEVNRAALEGGGLKLSDVEGKPFWECFWWGVSKESQQTLRQAISRASGGEFVRYDVEVYGRANGKETIIIDFSLIPVTDETGKVAFLVPEGRDITEKKAQEREIAQKNADLQALLERIRELDEIKTQFFANVSHELRTPLALIIGPAQRLMDERSTMTPHERLESAGVIARNARILLKHVNDLLDLSKLEAEKLKIELRDADVASLVRRMASNFDVLAGDRAIDYRVEAPDGVVCAVDPEKLERALMNLLSNAFKFAPDGGRIRCALRVTSKEVVIAVEDSGVGVEPELRRVIFERFRQGEGGANRQFGGTGLGLAIAKEFVEMHRGALDVLDSSLGGALFRITLPNHRLHPEQAVPAERGLDSAVISGILEELRPSAVPRATEPEKPATTTTILLVEDNLDMNRFTSQSLRAEYEVISAFNGQEGLEKAVAMRPSMIVSDIMMPVMSGVEMIAEIRKRPELAETPILILSAKADEELKAKLLEDGAQDFITKPFSERDLLVRVRNLIGSRQSREHERREAAVNEALYRVAASFADELDQQKLLQLITDEATTLIGAQFGSFFFNAKREDGGAYLLYTLSGAPPEAFARFPMPRATPLFGPTFRGEGVIRLDDVRTDPRYGKMGRQPEGHLPVVSYLAVPVVGRGGEVLGGLFFGHGLPAQFTEVHERITRGLAVQAAAALEKARLYEALRQSEARAREADRRKDEFLAMLGHELRNPLAPIRTALDLLALHPDQASDPEPRTPSELSLLILERQVGHMVRLVDDLLDVSRIAQGKVELQKRRVELADAVTKAIEMVSPMLERSEQHLTVSVAARGLAVDGDLTRLAQVIANLLTNASKYTPQGGLITITAEAVVGEVVLKVVDAGIGITAEMLPRVFDMFAQERQALDRSQGGLGLGLAIVHKLVTAHGGTVRAHSDGAGRGSEFTIRLPAAGADAGSIPTELLQKPTASAAGGSLQILVVDDNADAATLLALYLRRMGHSVRVAHDGRSALHAVEGFTPQVAFLDIGLPVMDGFELARRLRERPGLERLRLVAVTGYGGDADRRRSRDAGFDVHLVKPVGRETLKATLDSVPMERS
jgi:PAS domain S-box-containing protein